MQIGDTLNNLNCFINPKKPLSFIWVGLISKYIYQGT